MNRQTASQTHQGTQTKALLTSGILQRKCACGGSPGASNQPSTTREAPIGHRQPRADQVPSEKNLNDPNDPLSKENAALDRKIKSICRGC